MNARDHRPSWLGLVVLAAIAFCAGRWSGPASEMARDARADAAPVPRALPTTVSRWHDAGMGVTCWQAHAGGGLACLPDRALAPALVAAGIDPAAY